MIIEIPENIRRYVEDEKTCPLVKVKNVLWYSITPEEKESLARFLVALNAIPSDVFQTLPDGEKWRISCLWNDAERIYKNSIIRSE